MTVEATVSVVDRKMMCEPFAMCGAAACEQSAVMLCLSQGCAIAAYLGEEVGSLDVDSEGAVKVSLGGIEKFYVLIHASASNEDIQLPCEIPGHVCKALFETG